MTSSSIKTHFLNPVWAHLREARWPLLPLALAALLWGWRAWSAQSFGYWNNWLSYFTAMLVAYSLVTSLRIVLQSVCFDRALACWLAVGAAIVVASGPSLAIFHAISMMGIPTNVQGSASLLALLGAALLVIPLEIAAERARWARRAAQVQAQRDREQAVARQLVEARMTALQGQIEPHFLYNTLANARALIQQDAGAAEQLLQHLIRFLRSALPDLRASSTTLGQELDRARAYLDIMKMRMGSRLEFSIAASEEARACAIPPLSVMTLVENAIAHGIEPQVGGGALHIGAVRVDEKLRIEVTDNGRGFQSELGGGVGLVNLQERLATLYGDAAELRLAPGEVAGVRATIELPALHVGEQA